MDVRVLRVNLQRVLEVLDCLRVMLLLREHAAHVEQTVGLIGVDLERALKPFRRFGHLSPAEEAATHPVQGDRILGIDFERRSVGLHRRIQATFGEQIDSEVVTRQAIVPGRCNRVSKESFAVPPVTQLIYGSRRARAQNQDRRRACRPAGDVQSLKCRARAPRKNDENSNRRHIHVPVRQGLCSHLDQTDHRDQRSEKPEPACPDERPSRAQKPRGSAQNDRERRAENHQGHRPFRWIRIRQRQPDRPDQLAKISSIGNECILNPHTHRDARQRQHRSAASLNHESDNAKNPAQDEERDLLRRQAQKG